MLSQRRKENEIKAARKKKHRHLSSLCLSDWSYDVFRNILQLDLGYYSEDKQIKKQYINISKYRCIQTLNER